MNNAIKRVLDVSVKHGFLKSNTNNNSFNFGPLALHVANNIKNQWFQSNVVNTDLNVFLYESQHQRSWQSDCQFAYHQCLQATNEQLPLGLASVLTDCTFETAESNNTSSPPLSSPTNAYRLLIFIDQNESQKYFYRLQHQRKIWWRKFSLESERIQIVESKLVESEEESVNITAKFPWGTEVLETISNLKSKQLSSFGSVFEAKVGRKKQLPDVIECLSLEKPAVITYLCDAFQQLPKRTMLRLHHTLAPFKAAVAFNPTEEKGEELEQLARFVCLSLRQVGVSVLYSASRHSKTLDTQLTLYDTVGVPYTVLLTADTLTNGIVGLRSRDTTLLEQVHVSKLTSYMQKLLTI